MTWRPTESVGEITEQEWLAEREEGLGVAVLVGVGALLLILMVVGGGGYYVMSQRHVAEVRVSRFGNEMLLVGSTGSWVYVRGVEGEPEHLVFGFAGEVLPLEPVEEPRATLDLRLSGEGRLALPLDRGPLQVVGKGGLLAAAEILEPSQLDGLVTRLAAGERTFLEELSRLTGKQRVEDFFLR